MIELIKNIPKAELHLHIEGTLEPELMLKLSKKNNVKIPYKNIDEVKKAYDFKNLQDFLNIYYEGTKVLITKQDFYDLTWAYIEKCLENNIVHTEIFFDPQSHTKRGIGFETIIFGISDALNDAYKKYKITSNIIMCFLRHLSEKEAVKTLEQALNYKQYIIGVGLDSSEIGNPPSKFKNVFKKAKDLGFKIVAHAGEEADFSYINEAIEILEVERIDHGVQSINSDKLMQKLKINQIPLTICPNSNIELKVFKNYKEHNIKKLLDYGLNVTINSDDPAYFKGYINDNFINIFKNLDLTKEDIIKLVINSFKASFLNDNLKKYYINLINQKIQ